MRKTVVETITAAAEDNPEMNEYPNCFKLEPEDPRDEMVFVVVTNPDPPEDLAYFNLIYKGLCIRCRGFYTRKGELWVDFGDNIDASGRMDLIQKIKEVLPAEIERELAARSAAWKSAQEEVPF